MYLIFVRKIFEDDPELGEIPIKYLQDSTKRKTEYLIKYYDDVENKLSNKLDSCSIIKQKGTRFFDVNKFPNYEVPDFIYIYSNKYLSYLTGPLLVYFYKTGFMLDIKTYIKDNFTPRLLERFLFKENVECSKLLLERLLCESIQSL